MNEYKNFSYYFDEILLDIDYNEWINFTTKYINKDSDILDLACGTGTFAICLNNYGYKNISGLDLSNQMIEIAIEKTKMNHMLIDYYVDDMTKFKLNKKFDVITCYFDSINHLPTINDVFKTFDTVYNHLNDNGVFLFDIFSYNQYKNSEYFKEGVTFSCNYSWKTTIKEPNILEHNITICDEENIINEKYNEYYYDLNSIIDNRFKVLEISGDFLDFYDDESGRIIVALQKI